MDRKLRFAALAAAILAALPAGAAPGAQLLSQIDKGLARFNLETDTAALTTTQAAQLHLILSSPEKSYFDTRSRLKAVLRRVAEEGS